MVGYYNTGFKQTLCKCPKCGRYHKMKLFWTGNGTPRKYCHDCKFHTVVREFYYEEPHQVNTYVHDN